MTTVKRVISNPDEVGRFNSKISKPSSHPMIMETEDVLTPTLDNLSIHSDAVKEKTILAMTGNKEDQFMIGGDNNDNEEVDQNNKQAETSNVAQNDQSSSDTTDDMDKKTQEELSENEDKLGEGFTRQVSVDSSAPNPKAPLKIVEVTHSSTSSLGIRNNSESTVASGAAKDWGWFEDIHDHNNPKSPTDKGNKRKNQLVPFNEFVNPLHDILLSDLEPKKRNSKRDTYDDGTLMAVTAPTYVLEESASSQKLWKNTAGTRPPQPVEERVFYEKIWAQNFQRSQVDYKIPTDVLTATSPISLSPFSDGNYGEGQSLTGPDDYMGSNTERTGGLDSETAAVSSIAGKTGGTFYGSTSTRPKNRKGALIGPHNHHHTLVNKKVKDDGTDDELIVLVRGDNVFGTTVSKSFANQSHNNTIDTVSISIASYRVVESKKHGKYAQFLVIFCEGTFRDTIGVWKRYSDFEKLSQIVSHGHESCTSVLAGLNPLSVTEDHHQEMLPNAITSWNLLKKRKRWYRCLDAGYLSLKAFLLERFLHDILFESSSPQILRDFTGSEKSKDRSEENSESN